MSVKIEYLVLSPTTSPIAIPAQGDLIGTPASISASDPPQTVAIDDDPFDSRMSESKRTDLPPPQLERGNVIEKKTEVDALPEEGRVEPLHVFLGAQRQCCKRL